MAAKKKTTPVKTVKAAAKPAAPKRMGALPDGFHASWPRPFAARRAIIRGLIDRGVDPAEARASVGGFGYGTVLKWLMDHSGDILKIVLMLLPLFAAKPPAEAGA